MTRRYRNLGNAVFDLCLGLVLVACAVGLVVIFVTSDGHTSTKDWLMTVGFAFLGLCLLSYARTVVVVTPGTDTFVVRNPARSYHVRWNDVSRFSAGAFRSVVTRGYRRAAVIVELSDGRTITLMALNGVKRRAEWLAALNGELTRRKA